MDGTAQDPTTFPFLTHPLDQEGVDGRWLHCLSHVFRDVLWYHRVRSPLRVLLRPFNLVYWVDKNLWPWLWEGAQEEFDWPRYNCGVTAAWRDTFDVAEARACIRECLASGRIPIIRLEWYYVSFSPHYRQTRMNLHVLAVLQYCSQSDSILVVDRTALPAERGGLADGRGLVRLESLREAIEKGFGWFDYQLGPAPIPWQAELVQLVRESIENMHNTHCRYAASRDLGMGALPAFARMLRSLSEAEVRLPRWAGLLRWHLPACIRKYVVGARRMWRLVLPDLQPRNVQPLLEHWVSVEARWLALADSLTELGHVYSAACQGRCLRQLAELHKLEKRAGELLAELIQDG